MSLVSVSIASQQLNMSVRDIQTLVRRINGPNWKKKGIKRIPFDNSLSELYLDVGQFISSHNKYRTLLQISKVRKGNKISKKMKEKELIKKLNKTTTPSKITPPSKTIPQPNLPNGLNKKGK